MSKLSLGVEKAAPVDALEPLSAAARMLAEASTPTEVGHVYDLAAAAKRYAKSLEARNYATEVQLRAGRKGGQLLIEMEASGERAGRGRKSNGELDLDDLGIEPMRSSRWQALARKPAAAFERYIAQTKAASERLSLRDVEAITTDGVFSSDSPEWYTPRHVIDAVVAALGAIDLDPCAEPAKSVPARMHHTEAENGLSLEWAGRVYMNPPYGSAIVAWVEKLVEEYESGRVSEAIALVPARTETDWWESFDARWICLIHGRLAFSGGGPAPFPSAAIYLGREGSAFADAFAPLGDVYQRVRDHAA